MTINLSKTVFCGAIALAAAHFGVAEAHTVAGAVAAGGSDVYNFQCFTDTLPLSEGSTTTLPANRVSVRLITASGPGVSAQLGHISKGVGTEKWTGQVVDATTGVAEVTLIPPATKTAGVWTDSGYNLVIRNTSTLARAYNVEFHCRNGALHSGTGASFSNSQTPGADFTAVVNN